MPFPSKAERATHVLELVHADVCGLLNVTASGGYYYLITFTDDYLRFGYVYWKRHEFESFGKIKEFRVEVEKANERPIKTLSSDMGGEYPSSDFLAYLKENGIVFNRLHLVILNRMEFLSGGITHSWIWCSRC